jgi:hypothetical protein
MLDTLPGTRFLYNPPDTMLLIRAVREAVKDDPTFWAMSFAAILENWHDAHDAGQ